MANFLTYPIFQDIILPFVLVFTLIFAVLQKSKLLGDGVQQINAIISFVLAGMFVAFFKYVGWLQQFVIFLVIAIVILFVFLMIYGFAYAENGKGFVLGKNYQIVIGVMAFIGVIVAALVITDTWDKVYSFFTASNIGANVIFIILIAIAIGAVVMSGKKSEDKKS